MHSRVVLVQAILATLPFVSLTGPYLSSEEISLIAITFSLDRTRSG